MSSSALQAEFLEPTSELQAAMSLNPKDKEWIESRIRSIYHSPSGTMAPPAGSSVKLAWLKEWISPAIVVVFVITAFVEWNHFTNDMAVFRTHTEDRLKQIEWRLGLQASLQISPNIALQKLASADATEFSASLPTLKKISEQSTPTQSKLDPSTLQKVAEKLRQTDESSPDYWPTVLQFLRFASATLVSANVPPPGPPSTFSSVSAPRSRILGAVVLLDGGDFSDSVFTNSRIIFTQNPVRLNGVQFINCVLELPVIDSPNPYLKETSRILLASNLISVVMKTSG